MTLENINIINIRSNLPGGTDANPGVYPEIGDNIIKLTTSNSLGYFHYIQDGYFGHDWMLISTDKNGDVRDYNLDFQPHIPIEWSPGYFDGVARFKDATSGYLNSQEVLLELYAGASQRGAGEMHVLVRDSLSLEKIHQIEISTDTFEDFVFIENAFIEYHDGNALIAYAPAATTQDKFDGIVHSSNVGDSN